MILQALVELYDLLEAKGELERPGWQPVNVSYALQIDDSGALVRVVPLLVKAMRGGKEVFAPRSMYVPAQVKRSGTNPPSNFLCDHSGYMLGLGQKGDPEDARKRFDNSRARHAELLSSCDHPAARAILRHFERWKPEDADRCATLDDCRKEVASGANLVFMYRGEFAQDIPELKRVWDDAYGENADAPEMRCLVTGERGPIAVLHPAIKGVRGGQPTGTSLVSFNARAFESYGHDGGQGANAPVSARAAFAYGAALNWLIGHRENCVLLGDTTVAFWAEDAEPAYPQFFGTSLNGSGDAFSQADLTDAMRKLASGRPVNWQGVPLRPENRFYILGLAPNAGRLSVRFFLCDSFGAFVEHMRKHYERLEIVRPACDTLESLPVWRLLNETVNQNARDKSPLPRLPGETMRAILSGAPYPETLYTQVQLRLRAGDALSRGKAAIVKAYLIRNTAGSARYPEYKEALQVALNESNTYAPYLLGRLFAVLERVQLKAANYSINATIRDRYFNSASSTPAAIFPILVNLHQAHLKKLRPGDQKFFGDLVKQIYNGIGDNMPNRLSLQDQGVFQIGYYHQALKLDNR